jgi:hypothetical protein
VFRWLLRGSNAINLENVDQNKTSKAEGSGGEAAGFCRLEVASFGDEVTANRLFCKRGLQGNCMEAASSRFGLRSGQWAADAVGSVGVAD